MTKGPLVSVIMPTYNRVDKIASAINSVLKQTYRNFQLIISDDGSTDGTGDFIMKNYPQVDYIMSHHAGQAAARNKGLSVAKADIIASLDSDDKWDPEFLETCVTKLEADNLDFVFANWIQQFPYGVSKDFFSEDLFLKPYLKNKDEKWQILSGADLRKLYLRACPSPSSSAVMRKSSIVSGWNERINISDDWCLFLDMVLTKDCKAAFTTEVYWNKYINSNNIYDGRRRSELLELFHIQDTLEFMSRFKDKISKSEFRVLNKRCVRGFVELAKHHVIDGFDIPRSASLMRDSAKLSVLDTVIAIPDVILFGVNRRFRDLLVKLKRKTQAQLSEIRNQ